eukprot:2392535-Amphidinium_carterae.1
MPFIKELMSSSSSLMSTGPSLSDNEAYCSWQFYMYVQKLVQALHSAHQQLGNKERKHGDIAPSSDHRWVPRMVSAL